MSRDEYVLYELTGGNLALDLANTVMDRAAPTPDELLPDYAALVRWSEQTGLIDEKERRALIREAGRNPSAGARVLRKAIEIREMIFALFSAQEIDEALLRRLQALSVEALRHRDLVREGKSVTWKWRHDGLDQMFWPIVDAATSLLTSDRLSRLRVCGGENCRWFFIDNSRQGNRRWCDMTTCGNRAKAKRHYARVRSES
jgi:predicted RNA-binding Zn ribbon-like protein